MPRNTKIELLREQVRLARIASINADSAYRTAEAALNKAERAAAQRKARQPRYEYAVVLLDEHGDGVDTHFHDTLPEARKHALDVIPTLVGDCAEIVGAVIERIPLNDRHARTTVEVHGKVTPEWIDHQSA